MKKFKSYGLTGEAPEKYISYLKEKGNSERTIAQNCVLLNHYFKSCKIEWRIQLEAPFRVDPSSTQDVLTADEVLKVLQQPDLQTLSGAQHFFILVLLFYCGLRGAEVVELKLQDFEMSDGGGFLQVRGRRIALSRVVLKALDYYLELRKKDPIDFAKGTLFQPIRNYRTGTKQKALDVSTVEYVVKRYAKMGGLSKKVSPHIFRGSALANLKRQNFTEEQIRGFAGLKTVERVAYYSPKKEAESSEEGWVTPRYPRSFREGIAKPKAVG